jgi:hypothetical protein
MDRLLLQTCWCPWRRAPVENRAEAYGDSPAVESLNATVLVEFPLSKGPILLRFPASFEAGSAVKSSIKSS